MSHIIAVVNAKGGVGKSTLSSQMAFTFSALEFKVGVGDLDRNNSFTTLATQRAISHGVDEARVSKELPFLVAAIGGSPKNIIEQIAGLDETLGEDGILILDTPANWEDGLVFAAIQTAGCIVVPTPYDVLDIAPTRLTIEKLVTNMKAHCKLTRQPIVPIRYVPWKIPGQGMTANTIRKVLKSHPLAAEPLVPDRGGKPFEVAHRQPYVSAALSGIGVYRADATTMTPAAAEMLEIVSAIAQCLHISVTGARHVA